MFHFLRWKTSDCRQNYEENEVNLQLDGIQSRHVHLHEPILPVNSGDPAVMDASWDVTKPFPIFPKAVVLVIHTEWAGGCELKGTKAWLAAEIPSLSPPEQCSLVLMVQVCQLTRACFVRGILVVSLGLILDFLDLSNKAVDGDIYFFEAVWKNWSIWNPNETFNENKSITNSL